MIIPKVAQGLASPISGFIAVGLFASVAAAQVVTETVTRFEGLDEYSATLSVSPQEDSPSLLKISYRENSQSPVVLTKNDLQILCAQKCVPPMRVARLSGEGEVPFNSPEGLDLIRQAVIDRAQADHVAAKSGSGMSASFKDDLMKKVDRIAAIVANFESRLPKNEIITMGGVGHRGSDSAAGASVFYRMPISSLSGEYGHVGLSAGVGYLGAGSSKDVLSSETDRVSYTESNGSYMDGNATRVHRISRMEYGADLYELGRLDYQTPKIKGVSLYGGVGVGYGNNDDRTRIMDETTVDYVDHNGNKQSSKTSTTLGVSPGESWSGVFHTSFVGAAIHARKTFLDLFYVDSFRIEYERVLGNDEIKSQVFRLGVGVDF